MSWSERARRALLPFVIVMLAAGGLAAIAGASRAADVAWSAAIAVVDGAAGSVDARSMIRQAIGQRTKDAGIRAVDQTTFSECA